MSVNKVCSFTGHRPSKFNFKYDEEHIDCIRLKAKLINEIERLYLKGFKIFLTGCAMGVDIWCGEIVLQLMKKYKDIQLFSILPCNNYYINWSENYKQRLKNIMKNCTKTILLQERYLNDCYLKRNIYLVDKANLILAVYDINSDKSGTKSTLQYAIKKEKEVIIINIDDLQIYRYFRL